VLILIFRHVKNREEEEAADLTLNWSRRRLWWRPAFKRFCATIDLLDRKWVEYQKSGQAKPSQPPKKPPVDYSGYDSDDIDDDDFPAPTPTPQQPENDDNVVNRQADLRLLPFNALFYGNVNDAHLLPPTSLPYIIDPIKMVCSCPSFIVKPFLMCKHLIRLRTPTPIYFEVVRRRRIAPFWEVPPVMMERLQKAVGGTLTFPSMLGEHRPAKLSQELLNFFATPEQAGLAPQDEERDGDDDELSVGGRVSEEDRSDGERSELSFDGEAKGSEEGGNVDEQVEKEHVPFDDFFDGPDDYGQFFVLCHRADTDLH